MRYPKLAATLLFALTADHLFAGENTWLAAVLAAAANRPDPAGLPGGQLSPEMLDRRESKVKALKGTGFVVGVVLSTAGPAVARAPVGVSTIDPGGASVAALRPSVAGWSTFRQREPAGTTAASAALPAGSSMPQQPPQANPEVEVVFWQSIANSTSPAEFEAYLAQFPDGVFRALAAGRLSALRRPDPVCPERARCWMEISGKPGCYVLEMTTTLQWVGVTWTGACEGGLAQGTGSLAWWTEPGVEVRVSTGILRNGKAWGHWTLRFADGSGDSEGPFVDGRQHGHWVERSRAGHVFEGPYSEGRKEGHWVERQPNGDVFEGPYSEGYPEGQWVKRYANGNVFEGRMEIYEVGHWIERFANGDVFEGPREALLGKHGNWVERYTDGRVKEGPYVNDERHGVWAIHRPNGRTETLRFERGRPLAR